MTSIESRCKDEIIRLHVFFVDWFKASLPNTDEQFDAFTKCMAPQFHIVSPRGVVDALPKLTSGLRSAHGVHKDSGFTIEIKNCRFLFGAEGGGNKGCYLMTYEEWQTFGTNETARISTVMFREKEEEGVGDLEWVHVHETWLPDMGPP
mmetsp:Transcript_40420/g.47290  ORF Transcript_40420/g.47290 Transcript_40420/m.47290 type:complete len:149 (-) Transcript_40420:325-771(-)